MRKPLQLMEIPIDVRLEMRRRARELRRLATPAEAMLWQALRSRRLCGLRFRRQQAIGRFVVDFFCPDEGLIVEVDGPIHLTQIEADRERQIVLESMGYRVMRFTNAQVLNQLGCVLDAISESIEHSSQLTP